ncbi:hypothetical protein NP493_585g00001 [Ridgeia piscesae]|uniref:Uncharacterized protein n=1 Tax=Ridgeia piscesae TaxID=27915 RepID=A0AAD9KUJ7_RIDPI|nr:hypothetical protein NP493_585g00001 [Ridgeia piscesae]
MVGDVLFVTLCTVELLHTLFVIPCGDALFGALSIVTFCTNVLQDAVSVAVCTGNTCVTVSAMFCTDLFDTLPVTQCGFDVLDTLSMVPWRADFTGTSDKSCSPCFGCIAVFDAFGVSLVCDTLAVG